jgi:hypothetical protein
MISIYTTVAQHPKGFDLHIRNLHWAFSGFDHIIIVQTFDQYEFKNNERVKILSYDGDPRKYFRFIEYLDLNLGDIIVLVQQDNIFARKVDPLIQSCSEGIIITWDQGSYFAIYDRQLRKVYPRIGEISTFMRRDLVEEFKSFDLSFGCRGNQFTVTGNLLNRYRATLENHVIQTRPWLNPPDSYEGLVECCHWANRETFFEPFIYSFCEGKPVELLDPHIMLHLQNPERFHREVPETYRSAQNLLNIRDRGFARYRRYIPSVALMFLLSGVYSREAAVSLALTMGGQKFRSELQHLSHKADDWMSDEQLVRLHWANKQFGDP